MAEGGTSSVSGSEFVFDFYCELCNEEGLHKEAAGYCTECDEYFCGSCVNNHKKNRFTRYHEIFDKDNMPLDKPPSSDRVRKDISTMCQQHKGEPVKFYCKSHDKLTCSGCIVKYHKICTDIINITEISNKFFDDKEYKDFIKKLKTLQTQVHNITTKSCEQITASERYCDEAIEAVRQFREDIICTLDDIETRLKKEVDDIKTKDIANMKRLENTCSTVQEKLDKISSEFESLQSDKRVCQSFIKMKEATVQVNEMENQLKIAEDNNTINEFTFIPNTKLTEFFRELDAFGTISLNDNEYKIEQKQEPIANVIKSKTDVQGKNISLTDKNEDKTKLESDPKPKVVSSASFMHEIDVHATSDKDKCCITGSVVLSDNRLLVVDQNNRKVKLINTQSRRLISKLAVSGAPWDVTVITGDHVAVTDPDQNTIHVLKVTDSIIQEREIHVIGKCYGIVYSENKLIVSYIFPAKLEIMDMQGNVSVIMDTDKDGNTLFNFSQYICVSNDGDTIYVSDYGTGRVISMSRNGTIKAIYTDNELDGRRKLCIDHRGNVFVCGYHSKNIHMLTPDCTKIKVILTKTDGLTNGVYSVSHCSKTDSLFVGIEDCDKVKVYQLS